MYLLDATAASLFDPRRQQQAGPFIDWVRSHDSLLFLSAITMTEIETGILKLIRERKSQRASQLMKFRDGLIARYSERLLPVDVEVALTVARIADDLRPRVIELPDLIIAHRGHPESSSLRSNRRSGPRPAVRRVGLKLSRRAGSLDFSASSADMPGRFIPTVDY